MLIVRYWSINPEKPLHELAIDLIIFATVFHSYLWLLSFREWVEWIVSFSKRTNFIHGMANFFEFLHQQQLWHHCVLTHSRIPHHFILWQQVSLASLVTTNLHKLNGMIAFKTNITAHTASHAAIINIIHYYYYFIIMTLYENNLIIAHAHCILVGSP